MANEDQHQGSGTAHATGTGDHGVTISQWSNDFVNSSVAASGSAQIAIQTGSTRSAIGRRSRKVDVLRGRVEEQLGEAPTSVVQAIESIVTMADLQSDISRAAASKWGFAHYAVGIPSAILAASAAVIADNEAIPKLWVSACALLSAVLATLVTFLKSEGKQQQSRTLSAEWAALADRARVHLLDYSNSIQNRDNSRVNIDSHYSRIIVKLNQQKGRLLRGEVAKEEKEASSSTRPPMLDH